VNAGKPDLTGITGSWSEGEQKQYQRELLYFNSNQLLQNNALMSRSPQYQSGANN
jgi:hypothetical protein